MLCGCLLVLVGVVLMLFCCVDVVGCCFIVWALLGVLAGVGARWFGFGRSLVVLIRVWGYVIWLFCWGAGRVFCCCLFPVCVVLCG